MLIGSPSVNGEIGCNKMIQLQFLSSILMFSCMQEITKLSPDQIIQCENYHVQLWLQFLLINLLIHQLLINDKLRNEATNECPLKRLIMSTAVA